MKKPNNYRKYHIKGQSNVHSVKKNVIFLNAHNTIKHELAKSLGAIMLHRFGDVKFSDDIKLALEWIQSEVCKFHFEKNRTDFLTEASPNDEPDRVVDLVNLNEPIPEYARFEFETNLKILKKNTVTIYI